MLSLAVPTSDSNLCFFWLQAMIGNYTMKGQSLEEVIPLPTKFGTIEGSRGIWHENNVMHTKVEGNLRFYPQLGSVRPNPTAEYPDQVNLTVANYVTGNTGIKTCPSGLVIDGTSARRIMTGGVCHQQFYEYDPNEPYKWVVWKADAQTDFKTSYSLYRYTLTDVQFASNGYITYSERRELYRYASGAPYMRTDWSQKQPLSAFKDYATTVGLRRVYTYTSYGNPYWKFDPKSAAILSPTSLSEHVDSIARQLEMEEIPVEEAHYGDLAMQASERIQANHVNMIAFLRDLRKPKELIPRLRNLAKLKTHADNYLTVNYGILPTISDLQSIVRACKNVKAYLDKNGFSTYTAKSSRTTEVDERVYTVEQRIKLAIDDEDSALVDLIQRLESWGVAPTFENLWDLVPYSFVVDWFVDVGDFLERVDTRLRLMRLNIRYATMSRKVTVNATLAATLGHPYGGTLQLVRYHRWVSDQCPVPPLSPQSTFQDFNHWLESGALLTQRLKR